MKRSGSSRRWLARHVSDAYVKRASREGLRSRAAYKLEALDCEDRLFRPGQAVVDLGAAPGGWSQYLAQKLGPRGRIIAVDLLPMTPVAGVDFIQGDFTDPAVQARVREALGRPADLVISDMSPNITGIRDADEAHCAGVYRAAFDFSRRQLSPGGTMVVKVFEGQAAQQFRRLCARAFGSVTARKPGASRAESREYYLVCRKLAAEAEALQNAET